MSTYNTFTYKQSELPSCRPEIKSEIVALDAQISDLLLRCQGNYNELEQLAEVLDNCANSCELSLNSIEIISDSIDDEDKSKILDLCSLSERSKAVVYATGLASSVAIDLLCQATGGTRKTLQEVVSALVRVISRDTSPDEINQSLKQLADAFDNEVSSYEIKHDRD
jgi:hypothetical protein